ncbi:unnamed protein product [Rhizophagus irregularis]|nr:unnamed protein product [Rhizophagus irregularis]
MVKEKLSFITLVGVPMSLSIFSKTSWILTLSRIFSTDGAINEGRNYDDESYCITSRHPKNASEWAYKTQNTPVDTDFSGPETLAENRESQSQTDDNT